MPASCSCGRTWTGLAQAHCSVCHAHFSTVANFDRHKPSYDGCLDPATIRNRKTGQLVLKPSDNRFGRTWVGEGEFVRPEKDADPGIEGAA
jgi:hypothetical protein